MLHNRPRIKKGVWIDIHDMKSFKNLQEDFIDAASNLGFSTVGIPLKTRYGLRDFKKLGGFIKLCKKENFEVWGWMTCFYDVSEEEKNRKIYCKNIQGEIVDYWICPNKARKEKYSVEYKGNYVTYLDYLSNIIQDVSVFPIDGIDFQLFRYPGISSCWCEECQKDLGFEGKTMDLKNSENLDKWINFRVQTIEETLKVILTPLRSKKEISLNMFLELQCFGRTGQKLFFANELERIEKYVDKLSISIGELGSYEAGENVEEIRTFITYVNKHFIPLQIQLMGVTEYADFIAKAKVLEDIGIPFFIILPNPTIVIEWSEK